MLNPIALREAKIVYNFGLSECNRVNSTELLGFLISFVGVNIIITIRI